MRGQGDLTSPSLLHLLEGVRALFGIASLALAALLEVHRDPLGTHGVHLARSRLPMWQPEVRNPPQNPPQQAPKTFFPETQSILLSSVTILPPGRRRHARPMPLPLSPLPLTCQWLPGPPRRSPERRSGTGDTCPQQSSRQCETAGRHRLPFQSSENSASRLPTSTTARCPATLACELNTSNFCAMVIRGTAVTSTNEMRLWLASVLDNAPKKM